MPWHAGRKYQLHIKEHNKTKEKKDKIQRAMAEDGFGGAPTSSFATQLEKLFTELRDNEVGESQTGTGSSQTVWPEPMTTDVRTMMAAADDHNSVLAVSFAA